MKSGMTSGCQDSRGEHSRADGPAAGRGEDGERGGVRAPGRDAGTAVQPHRCLRAWCSKPRGAVAVLTSYPVRAGGWGGGRTPMGLAWAIRGSNLDVTRVTSTLDSLSRTSHMASPDHKHTRKYNPTRRLEWRKPELSGDWLDDCHMPRL